MSVDQNHSNVSWEESAVSKCDCSNTFLQPNEMHEVKLTGRPTTGAAVKPLSRSALDPAGGLTILVAAGKDLIDLAPSVLTTSWMS